MGFYDGQVYHTPEMVFNVTDYFLFKFLPHNLNTFPIKALHVFFLARPRAFPFHLEESCTRSHVLVVRYIRVQIELAARKSIPV